ncbi:MAG: matrixin family metalloprotease [Chthoniobacterales bacterium]
MTNGVVSFCFTLRRFALAGLAITILSSPALGYSTIGKTWPAGSVTFQFGCGQAPNTLLDGNTSWDTAALPAVDAWNRQMGRVQVSAVLNPTAPVSSGDRVNSVVFSNNVFGQAFGTGTLAVTYYFTQGSNIIEADVLFNRAQAFDSYRGPLRFDGPGGYATGDVRRVLMHELGHGLGLNHFNGDNMMQPTTSDRETLSSDDIGGIQSLYGVPTAPPAAADPSHFANISTRMKVGLNENALIGGFILRGSSSKKIILRATGSSLVGSIAGAMADPTLELINSAGQIIAANDNWQSSNQAAEIQNSGVAPGHPLEPALVATLAPGSYTAVVRGASGTQGIALVEGYELDTNATRLVNLSTRGRIGLGDEVLIGGLIVRGSAGKKMAIRALGPSLASSISGVLANPRLELYDSSGNQIASNDDWGTNGQLNEILASGLAPTHALESAILTTLAPGSYTAIVRGVNNGTGIGLVEVYDLEP